MTTTQQQIERRSFSVVELRASEDSESRAIAGHAAVFDVPSHQIADFREKIAPGAFAEAIKQDDVRALWNHNPELVLARTKSGTLRLSEDKIGLAFEMDVAETQTGNDALVSIRRGDVDEMSFGFITIEDEWTQEADQPAVRTLKKVRLLDVSPVAFPAYPETDVAVRSHDAWKASNDMEPQGISIAMRERQQRLAEAELSMTATRGQTLSGLLNRLIDARVTDEVSRGDIIGRMGGAAGISASTVENILGGGIDCPPLRRLRGFARVLGTTLNRLQAAAETDGCEYD